MPRPTIDYLNARREQGSGNRRQASGGKTYQRLKLSRDILADAKARLAGMDAFELIRSNTDRRFAEIRSADRERRNLWQSRLTNDDTF